MIFGEVVGKGHEGVNELAGAGKEAPLNADVVWLKSWCVGFFWSVCQRSKCFSLWYIGMMEKQKMG